MKAARTQVNIAPHSLSPLAPRVSIPPIPPKLPLDSFDGMSLELQEATILEDILYVLMVNEFHDYLTDRVSRDSISVFMNLTILRVKPSGWLAQSSKLHPVSIQVFVIWLKTSSKSPRGTAASLNSSTFKASLILALLIMLSAQRYGRSSG
jgi:hypothetical protein